MLIPDETSIEEITDALDALAISYAVAIGATRPTSRSPKTTPARGVEIQLPAEACRELAQWLPSLQKSIDSLGSPIAQPSARPTNKGRRKHSWDMDSCRHCGLRQQDDGWYRAANGQVVRVLRWLTPSNRLVRIYPYNGRGAPRGAAVPTIDDAFAGADVGGTPDCPKTPEAWD
jgi:hypothetical protein